MYQSILISSWSKRTK